MKITEAIDIATMQYPNEIPEAMMVEWLKRLDMQITEEVIDRHEKPEGYIEPDFKRYNMMTELIVPDMYAELYESYLKMKIAQFLMEGKRYSIEHTNFNNLLITFQQYYNRHHMPLQVRPFYR